MAIGHRARSEDILGADDSTNFFIQKTIITTWKTIFKWNAYHNIYLSITGSDSDYHAILARNPCGYRLTKNFRVSSHNTKPAPKPNATRLAAYADEEIRINQYSTLGARVLNIFWKNDVRRNINIRESVIDMAPKIYKFLVFFDPMGGCWTIDKRRVRIMNSVP